VPTEPLSGSEYRYVLESEKTPQQEVSMKVRLQCLGLVGCLAVQFSAMLGAQEKPDGQSRRYDSLITNQQVTLFSEFEEAVQRAASASGLSPQTAEALLTAFKTENGLRVVRPYEVRASLLEQLYYMGVSYPLAKDFLRFLGNRLQGFTTPVDIGFLEAVRQVDVEGKTVFPPGAVRPPRPIKQPLPPYTAAARKVGIEGLVLLKAVVLEDGSVANLKVLRGLGYGLDESAILTIQDRWMFQPGTVDGKPVNVEANIEIGFRLY
jgi:TonB family protein